MTGIPDMLKVLDKLGAYLKVDGRGEGVEPSEVKILNPENKYPILLWDEQLYRYNFDPQVQFIGGLEKFIC